MQNSTFLAVGENIHCTRIYKVDGKFCVPAQDGYVIRYRGPDGPRELPVPEKLIGDTDWEAGKVKHCAVAVWQANYGDGPGKAAGADYLVSLARAQENAGAAYLDINVDEFSTDTEQRKQLLAWLIGVVQESVTIPVSVDSSNPEILAAGLKAADPKRGRPMVNSVSLERADAVETARQHNAVVIASAAGEKGLPADTPERLANIAALMEKLRAAGFEDEAIHIDPLVFPIATDSRNGKQFLEAVTAVRQEYGPAIHIVAGLSNVSFGLPNRKLINQVFSGLAVDAGADGGIVDPLQINAEILSKLDRKSEAFGLARDLLTGEDEFGMNYIAASREGRL